MPMALGLGLGLPYLGAARGPYPALDLNFMAMAAGGVLDPRITFSRGTLATLTNAAGNVAYAPHNLLTWSAVSTTNWTSQTNVTITAASVADPEGAMTGATVAWGSASVGTGFFKVVSGVNGSANAKAAYVRSDVAGGTIEIADSNTTAGTATVTLTTSWQRISLSEAAGTQLTNGGVWLRKTASSPATVYVCWASFNLGPLQPYYSTAGSAYHGPRFTYDPTTHASLGLLIEEQRTNLLTYSEAFDNAAWLKAAITVTADSGVAPDGAISADLIVPTAASAVHYLQRATPTIANSTTYTWSVYAKASGYSFVAIEAYSGTAFNYANVNVTTGAVGTVTGGLVVSTSALGNGVYRFSVTMTTATTGIPKFTAIICAADATYTFTGDGTSGVYLWGAQLEAGAFATSYIPTTSATVTRAADSATMTGTNFSSWFNTSAGTFIFDAKQNGSIATTRELLVGMTPDKSMIYANSNADAWITYDGANALFYSGTPGFVTKFKIALSIAKGTITGALNGAISSATHNGSLLTVTGLSIGGPDWAAFDGTISRLRYYNTALTNAQLQALTT